jgi:phosphotransferase family enzyme
MHDATRPPEPPVNPPGTEEWEHDRAVTADGVVIPVRATAVRKIWAQLPEAVRSLVEGTVGQRVVSAWSAGTGFTPGFASRLDLADGSHVFVKAASSGDDEESGWPLSDAYREEARKLAALPSGIGAPRLLWHRDADVCGRQWIVLGLEYVDGTPPRRPWRADQLQLVLDKLAANAPALAHSPAELELGRAEDDLLHNLDARLAQIEGREHDQLLLHEVRRLSRDGARQLGGESLVHLDLRDDNVLIDRDSAVWFVDWNWPARGAAWIDLICLLISASGDGFDADALVADHPLTRDLDPHAIDCLLAALWSFWEVGRREEVPRKSPHLRNHQAWYADATAAWLRARLRGRGL